MAPCAYPKILVLTWQSVPINRVAQMQKKRSTGRDAFVFESLQVPPFWHGEDEHSLMSISPRTPL